MHLEAVGLGEHLATDWTLVWTNARVLGAVIFESGRVNKGSIAMLAFMRSFARMPHPVLFQGT